MKKIIALLAALLVLTCGTALADIAGGLRMGSFVPPEGANVYTLPDEEIDPAQAPEGLAPLYRAMNEINALATVYVVQAGGGMAFTSIAVTPAEVTMQHLLYADESIREGVLGGGEGTVSCEEGELYGLPCLKLKASLMLEELPVAGEGVLMPLDGCVFELWTVYPDAERRAFTGEELERLNADIAAARSVWDTLTFTGGSLLPVYTSGDTEPNIAVEEFADYPGRFRAPMPVGTVQLDALTNAGDREALIGAYLEANGEGVRPLLEELLRAVDETGDTLLFLPDGVSIADIGVFDASSWGDVTVDELAGMTEWVEQNLQDEYDAAFLLMQHVLSADGLSFCMDTYFLRCGETDLILDVMTALENGTGFEVDLYTPAEDDNTRKLVLWLMENRFTFPAYADGRLRRIQ